MVVGREAVHSAFPGSGLPVEGGMALVFIFYKKKEKEMTARSVVHYADSLAQLTEETSCM